MPSLRVDRLADGTENSQARKIVVLDVVLTHASEETDSGRCGVEVSHLPLVDKVPIPRCCRVYGRRLEDGGGDTVGEGPIDNVGVPSDPSDIGHASELVGRVDVKDVLDGKKCSEKVAGGAVDDTFGFTGGSGGLNVRHVSVR